MRGTQKRRHTRKKKEKLPKFKLYAKKNANFFLSVKHFFFNGLNLWLYGGWRKYFSFNFFFSFFLSQRFSSTRLFPLITYTLLLITRQGRFLWRWGKAAVPNAIRSIILFFLCVSHAGERTNIFPGVVCVGKRSNGAYEHSPHHK